MVDDLMDCSSRWMALASHIDDYAMKSLVVNNGHIKSGQRLSVPARNAESR